MTNIKIPIIPEKVLQLLNEAEADCASQFQRLDTIEQENTLRVLRAFQNHRISARHFTPTTGYGYDDLGRDTLSKLFADIFRTEDALVRPQIASGTHALSLCLYGILRPGDKMFAVGKPYDTLQEVIGVSGEAGNGSLKEFGVGYAEIPMLASGKIDTNGVFSALSENDIKLVLIQRSRGYDWRPSLSVSQINELIDGIHARREDVCVMVDNCYGEFTDVCEPHADLLAGSLIKNPGGGLAPTGGYIAGRTKFVEKVSYRLTSPGIGAEVGSYAGSYQPFYQGMFLAPHTVGQAVRSAILAARAFEKLGFPVSPRFCDPRNDIIQAIRFGTPEPLIAFCQAIQTCSPIDAEAVPMPWEMPGYQHKVIMAAGTFVSGASIELSADAPIREPYTGYLQGALTYAHGRLAIAGAIARLLDAGMIRL